MLIYINLNVTYLQIVYPVFFNFIKHVTLASVQFSSVAQSCPTVCNPMNHSTPGLLVHHQFPEFTQIHAH